MEAYTQDYYDEDYYEELIPIDPFIPATLDETCYIDYSVTSSGVLYGRSISFKEINTTCQKIKEHVRLLGTGTKTVSIIAPFSGLGLIFAAFLPIYSGAEILFISPGWAEVRISQVFKLMLDGLRISESEKAICEPFKVKLLRHLRNMKLSLCKIH